MATASNTSNVNRTTRAIVADEVPISTPLPLLLLVMTLF
jgi:hypothetical protein